LSVFFDNIYCSSCIFVSNLAQKNNRGIAEYFGVSAKLINQKSTISFLGMNTVSLKGRMKDLRKSLIMTVKRCSCAVTNRVVSVTSIPGEITGIPTWFLQQQGS
jgi:hypothetical protein